MELLKTKIKSSGLPFYGYNSPQSLAQQIKKILSDAIEQDFPREEDPDPIEVRKFSK